MNERDHPNGAERLQNAAHESREGYYVDADGRKADAAFHAPILNNRRADRLIQRRAVRDAMARGMSFEDAMHLYGNSLEAEDVEDLRG